MAKNDDALLKIFDYIELHWMAIFTVFLSFVAYMVYVVLNDIEYIEPKYKVQQIAIIEKFKNLFRKN